MVRSRQPRSSVQVGGAEVGDASLLPLDTFPMPPAPKIAARGAPQKASSKVKSVLGRAPTCRKASCDSAAAMPEHDAVAKASATPDASMTVAAVTAVAAATSLPAVPTAAVGETFSNFVTEGASLPPPPANTRLRAASGMISSAPAATAQKRATHCCGVCPSPIKNQTATAQNTVFVWLMMLKVTPSHRRYAPCLKRLRRE
mmetsp:Transcript_42178/g.75519  ORF Transcript_42178/g.75519 Transcript_42178/m.75519 type:complete len:201 (+) Transcript_42178:230-832(+)